MILLVMVRIKSTTALLFVEICECISQLKPVYINLIVFFYFKEAHEHIPTIQTVTDP